MSCFTLDTYEHYIQGVEAATASKVGLNPASPARSGHKTDGKLNEKCPSSQNQATNTRKTLSIDTASKLDPLSALNFACAADPWLGNALLTPTTQSHRNTARGVSASGVAALSVKVVDDDHTTEDWGDFVAFASCDDRVKQQECRGKVSTSRRPTPPLLGHFDQLKNLSNDAAGHNGTDPKLRTDRLCDQVSGPLPSANSAAPVHCNNTPTNAAPTESFQRHGIAPSKRGELQGFAATLMDRLVSLGTVSPRLGTLLSSPHRVLERTCDSYDVTFDCGPVGLDLETDWYGRQAVVKGFCAINSAGDEGAAKRCGLIHVGDILTAINGDSCLELNFQDTLALLRRAGTSRLTLHFEVTSDLSVSASDKDLVQARALIHRHKQRFYRPLRAHGLMLGCIERLRGKHVTAFHFHCEGTGAFLLAASCSRDGLGPFIFHTLRDSHVRTMRELPQSEDSAVYVGRLEPSFLGTAFTLFDHHTNSPLRHDHELAYCVYSANVLGRIPNSLTCIVSNPVADILDEHESQPLSPMSRRQQRSGMGSDGAIFNTHLARRGLQTSLADRFYRQQQSRTKSLTERLRSLTLDDIDVHFNGVTESAHHWVDDDESDSHARSMKVKQHRLGGERTAPMGHLSYSAVEQQEYETNLLVFRTKQPSWKEELRAWTLNFQGRVKVASKKNFLLVGRETNEKGEEEEVTALRFGKVSKTRFALDYAAPLAPIQALAVACSAFAHKRAVA